MEQQVWELATGLGAERRSSPCWLQAPAGPAMGWSWQAQTGLQVYQGGMAVPRKPISTPWGPGTHPAGPPSVSGTCPRRRYQKILNSQRSVRSLAG